MQPFNLNPMSIIDQGPLGGFRAGMADQRGLMHSDAELQSEQLRQQKAQEELETTRLNRPLDAAKRAMELAKAGEDQALIEEGTYAKRHRSEADLAAANAVAKMDENQRKRVEDQSDFLLRTAEELKQAPPAYAAANWDRYMQEAERYGLKKFPRTWSPEAQQRLDMAARAAWRTKEVLATESKLGIEHANRTTQIAQEFGQRANLARENNVFEAGQLDKKLANDRVVAGIRANADDGKVKIGQTLEQARAAVEAGQATPGQLDTVEAELRYRARTAMGNDLQLMMNQLEERALDPDASPAERKAAAAKVKAAEERIMQQTSGQLWNKIQDLRRGSSSSSSVGSKYADIKKGDLWEGKKVARTGWNGTKRVIQLEDGTVIEK